MPGPSPKNVLYLTPSVRLLGARRSLLTLVTHLDRSRWNPIVCGQSHGDLETELLDQNIPYKILKTGWWRKGKYFLWRPFAIAQLAALIRRLNVDLVHCNEIYPNPFAVRAAKGRRVPVITHMRLTVTPRMIRNYDLRRAQMIIVPSEAAGRDFDIWPDREE
ncbi:glycosyltransferase, partial [Candidatus Sumerlaeota bacterium]|nr:glycosyltransferase [Candidatus Sumerlaeota bacterium]